ncbi:rod-binding protein [Azospirillum sp. SYSU D00513]|uniref:rod-binding protein n=1 Tax=Azospirillum sp. SYSU D00513 TaxID=2812561 RepID=UPI001FFFB85A|nr:rod-binding protein [Azospirillum sp. SYSU D00513]
MDVTLPSRTLTESFRPKPADRAAQAMPATPPVAQEGGKLDPAKRAQIWNKAQEFETMFAAQMVGHMFEGIGVDETFGGGQGEEMFRSMLTNEYSAQITKRGGFGIADQVYRELLRAQEGA